MHINSVNEMQARAQIFKALGHPARLAMVVALSEGERCVCELQGLVGSDLSTVSKHLTVLRSVGLVEADKRGKQVFYSLSLPCTIGFLGCVDRALKERAADRAEDAVGASASTEAGCEIL